MTKLEFTAKIAKNDAMGILSFAARHCLRNTGAPVEQFVKELFEQDADPRSREGLKRCLGEEMYNELQKLK